MVRFLSLLLLCTLLACTKKEEPQETPKQYKFKTSITLIENKDILQITGNDLQLDSILQLSPNYKNATCSLLTKGDTIATLTFYNTESPMESVAPILTHLLGYNDTLNNLMTTELETITEEIRRCEDSVKILEQEYHHFQMQSAFNPEPTPLSLSVDSINASLNKKMSRFKELTSLFQKKKRWLEVRDGIRVKDENTEQSDTIPFPLPAPGFSGSMK